MTAREVATGTREVVRDWWPFVIQLAFLIWGASAIKSSVDTLAVTMREVQTDVNALKVDVGVLKAARCAYVTPCNNR